MATYPLTPVRISTIVTTDPTDAENPAKIGEALRQTRTILTGLLSVICNDDGTLKAPSSLAAASVSTASIIDLAVTTVKLADLAVTTAKIADASVLTAKLADLAVTTAKLAANCVDATKIANGAVGTTQLAAKAVTSAILANDAAIDANRAVISDSIKDSAIIERTIANLAVSAAKLKSSAAGSMFLDNGTNVELLEVDTDGDVVPAKVGGKIKFSFPTGTGNLLSAAALIVERGGSNAAAGAAAAATFNVRPSGAGAGATDLVELYDPTNMVSFVVDNDSGNKKRIIFAEPGTYYVRMAALAYKVGSHFARLVDKTNNVILFETGGSIVTAGTGDPTGDFCQGEGIMTITTANTHVQIEHWTAKAKTTDGLGTPIQDSGTYPMTNNTYLYLFIVRLD